MQITIFGLAVNDASAFGDAASFVDDDSKSTAGGHPLAPACRWGPSSLFAFLVVGRVQEVRTATATRTRASAVTAQDDDVRLQD